VRPAREPVTKNPATAKARDGILVGIAFLTVGI